MNGAGLARLNEEMRGRIRLAASGNEVVITLRHPGQKTQEAIESIIEVLCHLRPEAADGLRPAERMVP
jgi:hypothetical protein